MKFVLPVALLFASATAVQAQEPIPAPAEPTPVVAPAPAPAAPAAPVVNADVEKTDAPAATAEAKVVNEAVADEAVIVQDTPRNWWWMVGAIVLAGVILAVVL